MKTLRMVKKSNQMNTKKEINDQGTYEEKKKKKNQQTVGYEWLVIDGSVKRFMII